LLPLLLSRDHCFLSSLDHSLFWKKITKTVHESEPKEIEPVPQIRKTH